MAYLSPRLHQALDSALWLLCLLPIFLFFALLIKSEISVLASVELLSIVINEVAWLFIKIPFPGTWQIRFKPLPGKIHKISIPRAHTQWDGIEMRVEPDLRCSQVGEIQVRFASGRKFVLRSSDAWKKPIRIDCKEIEGTVQFFGLQNFTLIAFEDTHAWKDIRVAWLLRQKARLWIIWGGVIIFIFVVWYVYR